MSEYQYYEFQAIDRPLSKEEMAQLRQLSTRATITPARFVNVYNFGDFRGDPDKLMDSYFDAFLYLANWGTHRLMLRLPRRLLDPETAAIYCPGDPVSARTAGDYVVVDFVSQDEEGSGWVDDEEGETSMASILPVRAELARGDLRSLYLGWLLWTQETDAEEEVEPPVPPGLGKLSAPLKAFADFMRIDADLLAAAAESSPTLEETSLSPDDFQRWARALPETEKDALLARFLAADEPQLRTELFRRVRDARLAEHPRTDVAAERRTVAELRRRAEAQAEARKRREAEREAQRQREAAKARAVHLDRFVGREDEIWEQVQTLIQATRSAEYDRVVELLIDLRDLAARQGDTDTFLTRLLALRNRYSTRKALLERMDKARLVAR